MKELTFEQLPKAVAEIYSEILLIRKQLEEIQKNFAPKLPTEYLTRSELAEMLKCDISTIHNWTKKGKLKPYGIGNRVYYKRNEVESSLKPVLG
jgi:excisionase family DNA binding protein